MTEIIFVVPKSIEKYGLTKISVLGHAENVGILWAALL